MIGDNYFDGTYAWLNAYHGTIPHSQFHSPPPLSYQRGYTDLDTELLELTSGVIWNALNIDYSGNSFSHLGVFFG